MRAFVRALVVQPEETAWRNPADPNTFRNQNRSAQRCHVALGGRMVPFAGYSLPVQYKTGIIAEHNWTREHAGLFDVSHMGPCFVGLKTPSGDPEADHAAVAALVEPLVCGDIAGLKPGRIRYTLLLNEAGGTLDDLMIARADRKRPARSMSSSMRRPRSRTSP